MAGPGWQGKEREERRWSAEEHGSVCVCGGVRIGIYPVPVQEEWVATVEKRFTRSQEHNTTARGKEQNTHLCTSGHMRSHETTVVKEVEGVGRRIMDDTTGEPPEEEEDAGDMASKCGDGTAAPLRRRGAPEGGVCLSFSPHLRRTPRCGHITLPCTGDESRLDGGTHTHTHIREKWSTDKTRRSRRTAREVSTHTHVRNEGEVKGQHAQSTQHTRKQGPQKTHTHTHTQGNAQEEGENSTENEKSPRVHVCEKTSRFASPPLHAHRQEAEAGGGRVALLLCTGHCWRGRGRGGGALKHTRANTRAHTYE